MKRLPTTEADQLRAEIASLEAYRRDLGLFASKILRLDRLKRRLKKAVKTKPQPK